MAKLIGKGAEADLFLEENNVLKKVRVPKSYRVDELDISLRKKRTRSEAKILQKVGGIGPGFISCDNFYEIKMNFIEGNLVKDVLSRDVSLSASIGSVVGQLHDLDIVHGDLTTSNMILSSSNDLKLIDFGLSLISSKLEDKAVDLHLFKEAVSSKHFSVEENVWDLFLKNYNPVNKSEILKRLEIVESRGRNRQKF